MSNLEAMAKGKILSDICPVQSAEELNGYQLDGLSPEYVVKPKNAAEAAQVLALAASSKTPAAVTGNGTKFVYGSPLQKLAWVINTAEMVSEPEIKADDLMVFAQAGLPLSVLQDQLKQKNLFLPVDIGTNGATVGGLLAHGGGSSHRLAYGLIRDMVLGLTVALTDGKLYKFGGQTVKNVTGYDLRKLFIGSKGTLGVITDVCLRVYAIPPAAKVLMVAADSNDTAFRIAAGLEKLRPAVLEIYDHSLARQLFKDLPLNKGSLVLVKYAGPVPLVDKKYQDALNVLAAHQAAIVKEFTRQDESKIWEERAEFFEAGHAERKEPADICRVKISVPARETISIAQALEKAMQKNTGYKASLYIPAAGLIYVSYAVTDNQQLLQELSSVIKGKRGFILLEKGPLKLRRDFYEYPREAWEGRIKEYFDPQMVLNPGKRP